MRKVVKRPDGTEEVIEGTAEEVAEYERQLREGGKPASKKKPVLRGAEVDGQPLTENEIMLVRLSRLGVFPKEEKQVAQPVITPMPWPVTVPDPYWLEPACLVCGTKGCRQTHIWYGTTTSDKVTLLVQEDGSSKLSHSLSDVAMGKASVEVHFNGEIEEDRYSGMYPKH